MTNYQPNEYQPNVGNIKNIVEKLYHAVTGDKPDDAKREQLYAGVEGMHQLYRENPNAFYAVAAVAILETNTQLGLKSELANIVMKYIAQSFAEKAGYDLKDKKSGGQ
ncbi:MAG TPA: hypothetical protein VJA18_05045 [Candidatus Nanoarchaeia archaeon]|nr:hypothetical protein [Candidatus Nanoarchaeia archaeon]